jgi:predicted aspartyl protease
MKKRLVLTALLSSLISSTAAPAQPGEDSNQSNQNCPLHVVAGLEMRTMPDGRVTIPVQFEGHDHRLMVDTGGYINTVTQQLIKEEGYNVESSHGVDLQGIGIRRLKTYIEAKDFAIGNAHGSDFQFYVDVFNNLFADGTLAPEILANYDVDFDFGHDKFNLIQPQHCPGRVVYWTRSPAAIVPMEILDKTHIRVPVIIDGKEIMATLDTGSTTSIVSMRVAARIFGIDEKTAGLQALGTITVNGLPSPAYVYPFRSLALGSISMQEPYIQIVSDSVWNKDDLLLGIDALRQMHLYIAYGEKKLYATPALEN